ncbi:MAG: hypothetical protein INQ03_11020 [Candidatus Heimdallarchaeota archaeon]|nr:hypothetical protein [Candidatus Heimdallarchaeota archaeon]
MKLVTIELYAKSLFIVTLGFIISAELDNWGLFDVSTRSIIRSMENSGFSQLFALILIYYAMVNISHMLLRVISFSKFAGFLITNRFLQLISSMLVFSIFTGEWILWDFLSFPFVFLPSFVSIPLVIFLIYFTFYTFQKNRRIRRVKRIMRFSSTKWGLIFAGPAAAVLVVFLMHFSSTMDWLDEAGFWGLLILLPFLAHLYDLVRTPFWTSYIYVQSRTPITKYYFNSPHALYTILVSFTFFLITVKDEYQSVDLTLQSFLIIWIVIFSGIIWRNYATLTVFFYVGYYLIDDSILPLVYAVFLLSTVFALILPVISKIKAFIKTGSLRGKVKKELNVDGHLDYSELTTFLAGSSYDGKNESFMSDAFSDELSHGSIVKTNNYEDQVIYISEQYRDRIIKNITAKVIERNRVACDDESCREYNISSSYFEEEIIPKILNNDAIKRVKDCMVSHKAYDAVLDAIEDFISSSDTITYSVVKEFIDTQLSDKITSAIIETLEGTELLRFSDDDGTIYYTNQRRISRSHELITTRIQQDKRIGLHKLSESLGISPYEINFIIDKKGIGANKRFGNSYVSETYISTFTQELNKVIDLMKIATIEDLANNSEYSESQIEEYLENYSIPEGAGFKFLSDMHVFCSNNLSLIIDDQLKLVTTKMDVQSIITALNVPDNVQYLIKDFTLTYAEEHGNFIISKDQKQIISSTWFWNSLPDIIAQQVTEERKDFSTILSSLRLNLQEHDIEALKHEINAGKSCIIGDDNTIFKYSLLEQYVQNFLSAIDFGAYDINDMCIDFDVDQDHMYDVHNNFADNDPTAEYRVIYQYNVRISRDFYLKFPKDYIIVGRALEFFPDMFKAVTHDVAGPEDVAERIVREVISNHPSILFSYQYNIALREDPEKVKMIMGSVNDQEMQELVFDRVLQKILDELNAKTKPVLVSDIASKFDMDLNAVHDKLDSLIENKVLDAKIDRQGTSTKFDNLLVMGAVTAKPAAAAPSTEIKNINRERFEKIISRYTRIEIKQMARMLNVDETALQLWLLDLPESYGFTIDLDVLEINQDLIGEHIDELFSAFEEAEKTGYGKLD